MNIEFLRSIGVTDSDPNLVLSKLDEKEIELLDKRDLAETNGFDERVKEIDSRLEQLKKERELVKEDAKTYVSPKSEVIEEKKSAKEQADKKKDAYEKLMQKKKAEAQAAQEEVLTSVTKNSNQQASTASNTASAPKQPAKANTQTVTKSNTQSTNKATPQAQTQTAAQGSQSTVNTASVGGTGGYSSGLRYYQKQDYANALKCFISAAEAKSVSDSAAAKERTQASYLLATMYRDGVGTNKDIDRSNHYLRRAADFGYDQAQLEYGELVLSQHMSTTEADVKAREEGWKYIEKAADAGLVDAIRKYIDLAKNSSDSDKHIIDKAKSYISVIKGQLDSYEARKCDDWLNELKKAEKATKKKASYPKKYIIGEILFLIGTIYLFKGLNPIFFEKTIPQVNKFILSIPDVLIIKWDKLLTVTTPYMTNQGIFGSWLIILGNVIRGLGVEHAAPQYGKTKCNTFGKIVKFVIRVLCVAHFVANIVETSHFFGNGSYMQFLAMIGSILIGRLIGNVLYKIIK
jgi:outer membrane biosynthesis protein TonB